MKFCYIIFFFISLPIINAVGQETDKIICPASPNFYILEPSSRIPPLRQEGEYFGKVFVEAEIDTSTLRLINHRLIFAKLRSKIDSSDTLEIRLEKITGNELIIDELWTEIIDHISYLNIKKICEGDVVPKYVLPIEIVI
jgi:hypothetical protein